MDLVLVSRLALPILSIIIFIFLCKFTKAPQHIIRKSLMITPVAGILGIVGYLIGLELRFWHYTLNYLVFGLPLDRFFSASIAYGAGFGLIYWWLRKNQNKYLFLFIIFIPIYGVLMDIMGTMSTGTTFWSIDNPYWYIADFTAWTICWAVMVILYKKTLIMTN